MPLRDDLIQPISPEAPAGVDLSYDKVFDQIKEARTEDDESLPAGTWSRAVKKADRPLVIRLTEAALTTRSKDLRLAGWYGEALLRQGGFAELASVLHFLKELQTAFWDSLYPLPDDDGDLGRRAGALESAATQLATQMRLMPLTRSGVSLVQVQDARALAYEQDATTQERKEAREEAVQRGRVLPEELDKAIADTPKNFYAETDASLRDALSALDALDRYGEEQYVADPPSFVRLKSAVESVQQFVSTVLVEKRRLEPDTELGAPETTTEPIAEPIASFSEIPSGAVGEQGASLAGVAALAVQTGASGVEAGDVPPAQAMATASSADTLSAVPSSLQAAMKQVAAAVVFLIKSGKASELAYELAAAPGMALVFRAEPDCGWPPPPSATRQSLRGLARQKKWAALELASLEALTAMPETVWLDLQRYLWLSSSELGHHALAAAVINTVRVFLQQQPDLDKALLDDGTPMASMETQGWLRALSSNVAEDGTASPSSSEVSMRLRQAQASTAARQGSGRPWAEDEAFKQATELLKSGRVADAIGLLSHEAEEQPSGRLRFERRLQTAELCLQAGHAAVAQPLLADLTTELERRTLDGWEAGSLLGKPLALLIQCVDQGVTTSDSRETLFSRLCRLDPVAAAALNTKFSEKAG